MTNAGSNKVIIKSEFGVDSGFVETPEGKFTVEVLPSSGRKHTIKVSFRQKGQRKPVTEQTEPFQKFEDVLEALEDLLPTVGLYADVYEHIQSGLRSARHVPGSNTNVTPVRDLANRVNRENTRLNLEAAENQH